jgi:hypothetical protein
LAFDFSITVMFELSVSAVLFPNDCAYSKTQKKKKSQEALLFSRSKRDDKINSNFSKDLNKTKSLNDQQKENFVNK